MTHELAQHKNSPLEIFNKWYEHLSGRGQNRSLNEFLLNFFRKIMRKIYPPFEVHSGSAMVLSTVDSHGHPRSRVVLMKSVGIEGITFYTNYNSDKSKELLNNSNASLVFHWPLPERQVRVEGVVVKVSEEESDQYWNTRPRGSQIGAWASNQSHKLENREDLVKSVEKISEQFKNQSIPRPPHWGGYLLKPVMMEFWEGCPNRLHWRRRYLFNNSTHSWSSELLNP